VTNRLVGGQLVCGLTGLSRKECESDQRRRNEVEAMEKKEDEVEGELAGTSVSK
jgi:hypothetical protein